MSKRRLFFPAAIALVVIGFLLYLSHLNYLLYHSITELLTVGVGVTIFTIGWNTRLITQNKLSLLLAVAYLSIAVLDTLHALAYKGMGAFPAQGANLATQFWIAARYVESASLFASGLFLTVRKPIRSNVLVTVYALSTAGLIVAIVLLDIFPDCYRQETGLTTFKIVSEYVISLLLVAAGMLFWKNRTILDDWVIRWLLAAIGSSILAELTFTLYMDVYGSLNFLGHIFKLVSFIFIYLALVRGSLVRPYTTLFRDLARSESDLRLELAKRRRLEALALEAERLRAIREFSKGVAHNFNNVLTGILGHANFVKQTLEKQGLPLEDIDQVLEGGRRGADLSRQLSIYTSRAGLRVRENFSAQSLLNDLDFRFRQSLPENTQLVIEKGASDVILQGDAPELRKALLHICKNAQEAMSRGGTLTISLEKIALKENGSQNEFAVFRIADTGPGIAPQVRSKIFDPFFSTKQTVGVGLSLFMTRRVIEDHGGQIEVESEPGKGATFRILLPALPKADSAGLDSTIETD